MRIFGLKNCDTCRKVAKLLAGAELVDIRDKPLSEREFSSLLAMFGDDLVNRKSTTWRALSEAERAENPLALLTRHPTLMKRPVIEKDGKTYLGWGEETQKALL